LAAQNHERLGILRNLGGQPVPLEQDLCYLTLNKRGGQYNRVPLEAANPTLATFPDDFLDLDEALTRLAAEDANAARLVQLHYFTGLSIADAAVGLCRPLDRPIPWLRPQQSRGIRISGNHC
jgi:hypothetical protein